MLVEKQQTNVMKNRLLWALALALLLGGASCADTADDNNPPQFAPLESEIRAKIGSVISKTYAATDPDGDTVQIIVDKRPDGSQFVFSAGLARFSWAPLASDAAPGGMRHDLILAAVDSRGGKTTQRIVIVVEPSNGAPKFISSSQKVLDLTKTECIESTVQIQDDDSTEVDIILDSEAPMGMTLQKVDGKRAKLTWCPDEDQSTKGKRVWSTTITADDGSGSPVTQEFVVVLVVKNNCGGDTSDCSCNPPKFDHDVIEEQRGADDYQVAVQITDSESEVVKPTLHYAINPTDPNDTGSYETVELTASGSNYSTSIPNPLVAGGSTADIFYFICAFDNDDEDGDTCDNFACSPDNGRHHFVAYPPGDQSCRADDLEPNDSTGAATRPAMEEVYGLSLCPGDTDFYAFDLEADGGMSATVAFSGDVANVRLVDSAGAELAVGAPAEEGIEVRYSNAPSAGTYYLEITGAETSYNLFHSISGSTAACNDANEPNDNSGSATTVADGTYPNLTICTDDVDFYALDLAAGDQLDVHVMFTHVDGDLDALLLKPDGEVAVQGNSSSDNEVISYGVFTAGRYFLAVEGYNDAMNDYGLDVQIEAGAIEQCADDPGEPGNDRADATFAPIGDRTISDWAICPEDVDYVAINMLYGERISATLTITESGQDLDLAILDTDGVRVLAASEGVTQTERIVYTAPFRGDYFLQIYGYEQDASPYVLDIVACTNDADEPNDTAAAAFPYAPGTKQLELCLGESDWFKVSATAGQVILVELTSDAELENFELTLFDPTGMNSVVSGRIEVDKLAFLEEVPAAGDYLLRVKSLDVEGLFYYDLSLEVE